MDISMDCSILLHGDTVSLDIAIEGFERPEASDSWDAAWLRCAVRWAAVSFVGVRPISLMTHDIVRFRNDLIRSLRGEESMVRLSADEDGLEIALESAGWQGFTLKGRILDHGSRDVCLVFHTPINLTELDNAYRSVLRVCTQLGL